MIEDKYKVHRFLEANSFEIYNRAVGELEFWFTQFDAV